MDRLVHWYVGMAYVGVILPCWLAATYPLGPVPVVYDPFLGGLALAGKIPGVSGTGTTLELYNFLDPLYHKL